MIAAEIAVSNLQQEASDLFRLGQRVAESGRYHPKALSELRVSLASQEMWFGNRRKGKKLLRLGLEQASENALAQIAWFARRGMFSLDEPPAVLPESPEALAWQHFYRKEWSDSISACERWWRREPFSSRPAELASAIAAIGVRDAALCVAHAEQGLRANPTNSLLWNNVAVGMAYMGRVQEAREALLRGAAHDHPSEIDVVLGATRGLVEFRAGSPDSGRRSYAQAIERAERAKWYRLAMLAKLHLIEEELRLGHNKEEYLPDLRAGADDDDVLVSVLAKRLLEERE
ncbi:MAG: tetratricopeptide repeat protein [Planctomycetota bacterium]